MENKPLAIFLVGIFCLTALASALTWDLGGDDVTKVYNTTTKIVTIENATGVQVELQLTSTLDMWVGVGNDTQVAEFSLIDYIENEKLFDNVRSYDLADGNKEISKTFWLKYGIDYQEEICMGGKLNKTSCQMVDRINWTQFENLNELPSKNIKIGLFTDTTLGETVEWVPVIKGIEVLEWATYTVTATGWVTDGTKLNTNNGNYYHDGYLYGLGLGTDYLAVYDVTGGAGNPSEVGYFTSASGQDSIDAPNSVFVKGDYAYVTSNTDNNVVIFDISAHTNPIYTGNFTGVYGGLTYAMTDATADYMYAVGNGGNVTVIDITDKANPVTTGSYASTSGDYNMGNSKSVFWMDGYLYVTSWASDRLVVLDARSNTSPTAVGFYTSATGTDSLDAAYFAYGDSVNEIMYTISNTDGNVAAFDISGHGNPAFLGGYGDISGEYSMAGSRQLYYANGYVYVSAFTPSSVTVLNVTNVSLGGENPFPIGYYSDTVPPNSVEWSLNIHGGDGYVYAGTYNDNGITQLNFTDLFPAAAPTDTCTYTSGNWEVNCADNCSIIADVDLGNNNITINGSGIFDIAANITNFMYGRSTGTNATSVCAVTARAGGGLRF